MSDVKFRYCLTGPNRGRQCKGRNSFLSRALGPLGRPVSVTPIYRDGGPRGWAAAAEIVRRAERGIGVAIRRGKEAGVISKRGGKHGVTEFGRSATEFVPMTNSPVVATVQGIYALTEGVPDDTFEQAIEEAKEEPNLSRANVVRKVTGGGSSA